MIQTLPKLIILSIILLTFTRCGDSKNNNIELSDNIVSNTVDSVEQKSELEAAILKDTVYYLELMFSQSYGGTLPHTDIEKFTDAHHLSIKISGDELEFNQRKSKVDRLKLISKNSLLKEYENETNQVDVYLMYDSVLRDSLILEILLDYRYIPFSSIALDRFSCVSYVDGVISVGEVLKYERAIE